ncbi:MAG: TetR/AcrR family transcriptional regulator [Chloroflexi bacterium]|nr:TetR/AcrR family transcriptional regulator [Chloroflexota bacterium]
MYSKSALTIAHILEAARKLFASKNYADVTMVEIAETAQVTKGALYHHFASKEALYLAMMHADLQEKQALMHQAVESAGSCRERLRRLTMSFLELPPEVRDLMKLVRRDVNVFRDPIRNQLVRAYQAALPEQVQAIIGDGLRDGELAPDSPNRGLAPADARLLAWQYVAMVEVTLSRYAGEVFGDNERMADFVIGLFFEGAGRRGG